MTSTSFNVGLGDGSRASSRVLRPPGGGHTDIFGGDPEPPRGRRLAPASVSQAGELSRPMGNGDAPATNGKAEPQEHAPLAPEPTPILDQLAPIETAPAPAAEPKKAEPVRAEPQAAEAAKPRVRVPPGGFSSGLW